MSRNAPPKDGGALRDIPKDGCERDYILPCFRVMQSMKGMGAFSFAEVVLHNSVLGTLRFYDQDKDEEGSEYEIFAWDNIERAQACVILAGKT